MLGVSPLYRPLVRATLGSAVTSSENKRSYLRGRMEVRDGVYTVEPIGGPGSHLVADLALANAFIVIPEQVTAVPAGSTVSTMMLERRQG
jgi:molybdopterin molybdotransferase